MEFRFKVDDLRLATGRYCVTYGISGPNTEMRTLKRTWRQRNTTILYTMC